MKNFILKHILTLMTVTLVLTCAPSVVMAEDSDAIFAEEAIVTIEGDEEGIDLLVEETVNTIVENEDSIEDSAYTLTPSDVTLEDTKIKEYNGGGHSKIIIPSEIGGTTITEIGDTAFENHKEIYSVVFPDTLTRIGKSAFATCFSPETGEKGQLVIPGSVIDIGEYAFCNCKYLETVTLQDATVPLAEGITWGYNDYYSESSIFMNCPALKTIHLSNNVVTIPDSFARNDSALEEVEWNASLKNINDQAFESCEKLKKIDLSGTNVENIEYSAFRETTSVTEIKFPNTLMNIGVSAFQESFSPETGDECVIVFPASLRKVGEYAFHKCKYLTKVTFTDTETPLAEGIAWGFNDYDSKSGIFMDCPALKTIHLSNNVVTVPASFARRDGALEEVEWNASLRSINKEAFKDCEKLNKVDLSGTNVENIEFEAFCDTSSVQEVKFPETLIKIGIGAFNGCSFGPGTGDIGKLIIPASVKEIGEYAFANCKYLKLVSFMDVDKPLAEGIKFGYSDYDSKSGIFRNCPHLQVLKLSNNVKKIRREFAGHCPMLINIFFANNIESIEQDAFYTDLVNGKKVATSITSGISVASAYDWGKDNRTITGKEPTTEVVDPMDDGDLPAEDIKYVPEKGEEIDFGDITLPMSELTLGIVKANKKKGISGNNIFTVIPYLSSLNGTNKVVWSVTDIYGSTKNGKRYLSVSKGKLMAKPAGVGQTVIVKAQLKNGKVLGPQASMKVKIVDDSTVTLPTASISENKAEYSINVKGPGVVNGKPNINAGSYLPIMGQTPDPKNNKVKWSTSDKYIATVNSAGKVVGRHPGIATITATLGDLSTTYKVTVKTATITLDSSRMNKKKAYETNAGQTVDLASMINTITGVDDDKTHVYWSIPSAAHRKLAMVSEDGKVKTFAKQSTITYPDGKTYKVPKYKKAKTIIVSAKINGVVSKIKVQID